MMKIKLKLFAFICCIFLSTFSLNAQTGNEIKIGSISPGEIDYAGFTLDQDATIHVEGTGASFEKMGNNLAFYGWILDSESRELVWSLYDEYESKYFHGDGSFDFKTDIKLKKGSYEIYYTGMYDYSYYKYQVNDLTDLVHIVIKSIADDEDHPYFRNEKYFMKVSCTKGFSPNNGREHIDKMLNNSIVSFVRTGDDEMDSKNFALKKETKLHIYCLGEKKGSEFYDYGWIYNLKTHEKVWPDNVTDFDRAGGGRKNVMAYQEIVLPAGEYQVNYVTDGSHSFDRWNVMPPNDPQMWGITVWCDNNDKANVSENTKEYQPVVDLTKIRDDEFKSQGFELIKDLNIRVICLGEIADYEPADYGWIIDAKTRETVWKFTRTKSEYAGGGIKNRIVNEVISLKKGNYIAYFASDGSHSYGDWNVAPPNDQKLWGLSIWTVNDSDKSNIKLFDEEKFEDENVITEIIRVRDNERKYENFTLDKELKVRVYAIGEGDDGYMYDSGWIKNMDTGKIVWEMTYRASEHAGGAHKNRMINTNIILPKGNYRLYYESDGSHSYMDWNADPPNDQMNYGIKVLKE